MAPAAILLIMGASLVVNYWVSTCRTIMTCSTGRTDRKLCMVSMEGDLLEEAEPVREDTQVAWTVT